MTTLRVVNCVNAQDWSSSSFDLVDRDDQGNRVIAHITFTFAGMPHRYGSAEITMRIQFFCGQSTEDTEELHRTSSYKTMTRDVQQHGCFVFDGLARRGIHVDYMEQYCD